MRPVTLNDDPILDMTVREFLERAARAIVSQSSRGPDFDKRIDLYYDVEFRDPTLYPVMGKKHRVRTRIKITATSLLFEPK
jgi:hypothetical protein